MNRSFVCFNVGLQCSRKMIIVNKKWTEGRNLWSTDPGKIRWIDLIIFLNSIMTDSSVTRRCAWTRQLYIQQHQGHARYRERRAHTRTVCVSLPSIRSSLYKFFLSFFYIPLFFIIHWISQLSVVKITDETQKRLINMY